jgi:acylphosphatase
MKIRAKIIGKVHDVGYRVFLTNLAVELGAERFGVFNSFTDGKETVIALLDCRDSVVDKFKRRIEETRPAGAVIEGITYELYEDDVPPVEITIQVFQMEQWGKAIPIMVDMSSKQDRMLEKQDETLQEIKGAREDLKTYMNRNHIEEQG